METYRELFNQEERYSQQAVLMTEREQFWSQADFEKFTTLVNTIIALRKILKTCPHYHPNGSNGLH